MTWFTLSVIWAACVLLCVLAWLMNRREERFRHIQGAIRKGRPTVRPGTTGNVVYNAAAYNVERFYFTGLQILQAGQALVFQDNPATSLSTKGFPFDVQLPDANTKNGFCGIVHPESVGFTGPGYISVIVPEPGDILQVLAGSTNSDQSVGYVLQLDNALPTASSTNTTGGSGNGAFRVLDLFTLTFASNTTVAFSGSPMSALFQAKCRLLESFASVANTQSGVRALKWVQFI